MEICLKCAKFSHFTISLYFCRRDVYLLNIWKRLQKVTEWWIQKMFWFRDYIKVHFFFFLNLAYCNIYWLRHTSFSTNYLKPCSPNGSFSEVAPLVLNLLVVVSNYECGYVMASMYDHKFLLKLEFTIRPSTQRNPCSSRKGLR